MQNWIHHDSWVVVVQSWQASSSSHRAELESQSVSPTREGLWIDEESSDGIGMNWNRRTECVIAESSMWAETENEAHGSTYAEAMNYQLFQWKEQINICWVADKHIGIVLYLHNTNQPVLVYATTSSQTGLPIKLVLPSRQVPTIAIFLTQSTITEHRNIDISLKNRP